MNTNELVPVIHTLSREWFQHQIDGLPSDELPPLEEIEADIIRMRDGVLNRISSTISNTDCIKDGEPDDEANQAAITKLAVSFRGLERTTPIYTALALSKIGNPIYSSGWPLCAIRLIAETWLPEVKRLHAAR